jgi:hypothetical protein
MDQGVCAVTKKEELDQAVRVQEQAENIYLYEDSSQEFEDAYYDACDALDAAVEAYRNELL